MVSCDSLTCALAIRESEASSEVVRLWGDLPGDPRVSLLMPVYGSDVGEEEMKLYDCGVCWPGTDNYYSASFFKGRETMATWSALNGWKVDEETTEKCREEEAKRLSSRHPKGKIFLGQIFARRILTRSSFGRVLRRRERFLMLGTKARGAGWLDWVTGNVAQMAFSDKSVPISIASVMSKQLAENEPVRFSSCTHITFSTSHFLQHFSLHCVLPSRAVPVCDSTSHANGELLARERISFSLALSPSPLHAQTHHNPEYHIPRQGTSIPADHGV